MKKLLVLLLGLLAVSGAFASTATSFGDPAPWADTLFVRGGFNGWGTTDAMAWNPAEQTYTAKLFLDVGDYEFKIANNDWNNPDFGPTGDPNVTLGVPTAIGTAIGVNFALSITAAGGYLFTLSDIAPDLQSGVLTVTSNVPIPAAGLLLLSAIGGLGFLRRRR